MSDIIFNILLALIVIISIIHLRDMKKSGKRMDRSANLLERYIALMEKGYKKDDNENQ